eukprot:gene17786-biopygen4713
MIRVSRRALSQELLRKSSSAGLSEEPLQKTSAAEILQKSSFERPPRSSAELRGAPRRTFKRGLLKYLRRGGPPEELFWKSSFAARLVFGARHIVYPGVHQGDDVLPLVEAIMNDLLSITSRSSAELRGGAPLRSLCDSAPRSSAELRGAPRGYAKSV